MKNAIKILHANWQIVTDQKKSGVYPKKKEFFFSFFGAEPQNSSGIQNM